MSNNLQISEEQLLYCADKVIDICQSGGNKIKAFDGFIPIVEEMYNDDENFGFFLDVDTNALENKVDVSLLRLGLPDGKTQTEKHWQMYKVKKIGTKELRKRAGIFTPDPYCFEIAFENEKKVQDAFWTFKKGQISVLDIPNTICTPKIKSEITLMSQIALGAQFLLENTPHIYLKPENANVGFSYPISNLSQVKELFALRDIPDGYTRRVALKHWVAKHWRKKPNAPEEMVEVRKHLRGKETFKWFGIEGTIFPA